MGIGLIFLTRFDIFVIVDSREVEFHFNAIFGVGDVCYFVWEDGVEDFTLFLLFFSAHWKRVYPSLP